MPRFRALVLLSVFAVNQAACYSWQAPWVTPQAYVAQHPDSVVTTVVDGRPTYEQRSDPRKMRLTLKGEQGTPPGQVVLTRVRFTGNSVLGRDPKGQSLAYSLGQVATFEVRGKDGVRTALLVAATGLVVAGVVANASRWKERSTKKRKKESLNC